MKQGYIAMTSAIIISMLVMVIVFSVSIAGYFGRSDILTSEFKELTLGLAEGCTQKALLRYAEDDTYTGNETINIDSYTCDILTIETSGSNKVFKTKATFKDSRSNIKVIFNPSDMSIVSWEELSNL